MLTLVRTLLDGPADVRRCAGVSMLSWRGADRVTGPLDDRFSVRKSEALGSGLLPCPDPLLIRRSTATHAGPVDPVHDEHATDSSAQTGA